MQSCSQWWDQALRGPGCVVVSFLASTSLPPSLAARSPLDSLLRQALSISHTRRSGCAQGIILSFILPSSIIDLRKNHLPVTSCVHPDWGSNPPPSGVWTTLQPTAPPGRGSRHSSCMESTHRVAVQDRVSETPRCRAPLPWPRDGRGRWPTEPPARCRVGRHRSQEPSSGRGQGQGQMQGCPRGGAGSPAVSTWGRGQESPWGGPLREAGKEGELGLREVLWAGGSSQGRGLEQQARGQSCGLWGEGRSQECTLPDLER